MHQNYRPYYMKLDTILLYTNILKSLWLVNLARLWACLSSGPGDGLGEYMVALTPDREYCRGMGLGLIQSVDKPSISWPAIVPSDTKRTYASF